MMKSKKVVNTLIILALMLLFRFIPPITPLTPVGMEVIGIFLGCIFAWTVGEVFWPSVLALFLVGLVGENSISGIFTATFGNATLHMVFLALAFCYAVEKSGLIELIAKYILSRKFARKDPWALALAFWIATYVTSAVTTATTAIIILCWEMFYEVVRKAGMEKKTPYTAVVIIGILIAAYLGGSTMPYNAFTQICCGVLAASGSTITLSFIPYLLLQIVVSCVALALLYLVSKYLLRIKIKYDIPENTIDASDLVVTRKHKIISAFVLLFCLIQILPNFLPEGSVKALLSNVGFSGGFAIILVALSLIDDGEGGKMFSFIDSLKLGMPYGMIILVATALQVSSKLTDASTGVSALLTNLLAPITSIPSPMVSMALLLFIGLVLTHIINNIVAITIMVPIGVTLLSNISYRPDAMISLMCLVLLQGLIMPSSSMAGAMLHGNDEWISSQSVYKYGTILELVLAVVVSFVGVPLAQVIFSALA